MVLIDFGIKRPDDFSPIPDDNLKKTIIPQFERIVEKYPERTAIKGLTYILSYRELNNAINHLAYQIIQQMSEDKSPIAFLLGDEVLSVIVFMAVLKSGRPYTGLYPGNSSEQLKTCLEDSTAQLLITSTEFKGVVNNILNDQKPIRVLYFDEIKTHTDYQNPEYHGVPNDLFGIFYTSGSTGKPKGVMETHRNRSKNTRDKVNEWFISPSDHVSLLTSVCFFGSYTNILGALLAGGLLLVFDLKANTAQKALDWMLEEGVTVFQGTTSIFRSIFGLASNGLIFSKLRFINIGGEPVTSTDIELFKAHTANDCVLINNFASTECGAICHYPVHHRTPPFDGYSLVGYPAPDKEVFLVDHEGQVIKDGQEGEIVVRSRFLSPGYWGQPELTAQKFHAEPDNPEIRIFYTGDIGRWREDGALEVLGRADSQVKIRGYRVQLEAVDLALRGLDGVRDAATIVHESQGRGKRLIAYVVMSVPNGWSVSALRSALGNRLPDYMIPSVFIRVDALPRTTTGKLDRKALPEASNERPELEAPFVSPRNPVETQIASVWQDILEIKDVGIEDNFFELGGDSLMALEMTLGVEKLLTRIVPAAFFKNPTISFLATLLETGQPKDENNEKFIIESHKQETHLPKEQTARKITISKITRRIRAKISWNAFDELVDRLVARYIVSRSYTDATQWAVHWSQNVFIRDLIYQRRYTLFSEWVTNLRDCHVPPREAFQMSLLANMTFGTAGYLGRHQSGHRSDLQAFKNSRYPYWQTLAQLLEATPIGQLNGHFPISGVDQLTQALQLGRGVILLGFHGGPSTGNFLPLERFLELDRIPTISYRVPIQQSRYHGNKDQMSEEAASTLNAEIALYGQKRLQEGGIINFASDNKETRGRVYKVSLAGRMAQFKGGFAELALNTGAKIIPHFRYCLPDGRIHLSLGSPLNPGGGVRSHQVETLLEAYAAFIESTWTTHPDAMKWSKIKRHLSRPLSENQK